MLFQWCEGSSLAGKTTVSKTVVGGSSPPSLAEIMFFIYFVVETHNFNRTSVEKVSVKTLIATALALKSYPASTDVLLYVSFPASYFKKGRLSTLKQSLIAGMPFEAVSFARSVPFKIKKELHNVKPLFEGFPLLKARCRLAAAKDFIDGEQFTLKGFPSLRVVALNIGTTFYAPETLAYWTDGFGSDLEQVNPLQKLLTQLQGACYSYGNLRGLVLLNVPPLATYGYLILFSAVELLLTRKGTSSEDSSARVSESRK